MSWVGWRIIQILFKSKKDAVKGSFSLDSAGLNTLWERQEKGFLKNQNVPKMDSNIPTLFE